MEIPGQAPGTAARRKRRLLWSAAPGRPFLVGVQRRAEADRPLRADHHRNLLLPRVGREQVTESFLQACNALIVVLPDLSEELKSLGRFRGRRDEIVIEREGVEKPWGRRNRA